jgi:Leucine-rich repeat (LRR) protein
LGLLTSLSFLDFNRNDLEGTIPSSFGLMKSLSVIGLEGNSFNGTIPSFLGSLPLKQLALDYNSLTGTIPASLGLLTKLQVLNLAGNGLTGTIPSRLTSLKALTLLYLFENKLTGLVPLLSLYPGTNGGCALDVPAQCTQPYCNHFKCPLPPGSDKCKWRSTTGGADHPGVHCE